MNGYGKPLPPVPPSAGQPRPLNPWGRSTLMCDSTKASQVQRRSTDIEPEISALRKENKQLRGLVADLTDDKRDLEKDLAESKRLRAIADEYRKTLSNLMSYTVLAVTECKEKSKAAVSDEPDEEGVA